MVENCENWRSELTRRGTPRVYRPRRVNKVSDQDFLLARIEPDTNGGCWLFTGPLTTNGYGMTNRGQAHRLSYRAFIGDPGPALVCHTCDVRSCVNPAHLWLGSHKDNADDMIRKRRGPWAFKSPDHLRRWQNGDNNPASRLSSAAAAEIRASDASPHALAEIYGVSYSTINRVKAGSIWRNAG